MQRVCHQPVVTGRFRPLHPDIAGAAAPADGRTLPSVTPSFSEKGSAVGVVCAEDVDGISGCDGIDGRVVVNGWWPAGGCAG